MTADIDTKALAFRAWQFGRNGFHEGDATQAGPSWDAFVAWWNAQPDAAQLSAFVSDGPWRAFVAANPPSEPHHGAEQHFAAWWATVSK